VEKQVALFRRRHEAERAMDNEESKEVILQQMQDTRSSLADKLENLEQQVVDTVHTATNAVADTVSSVKDAVCTGDRHVEKPGHW
jgi:hypothetical protein